jgi:tetratricopeptide (TPR) repeat protein
MKALRNFLCWVFALSAVLCVPVALPYLHHHGHRANSREVFADLVVISMFLILGTIFGVAWWTVWRGKRSGRLWGIIASSMYILQTLPLIYFAGLRNETSIVMLGLAGTSLFAFARRYETPNSASQSNKPARIPGDGTSDFADAAAQILIFAVGFGVYYWWLGWLRTNDIIPVGLGGGQQFLLTIVVLIIITALHEAGHAATGLALGMKIRGFVVGPFHWHIRDGRWEFQFKLKAILSGGGATGIVPARADFPRWRFVLMLVAGCLINLLTGIVALWIAFTVGPDSPAQVGGLSALFGGWSVALGVGNLIPFRTRHLYSDGARIYHLFANGPIADFDRALMLIQSSLVTPLRPKDYDIEAIFRASRTITQGIQALLLRLYAYYYFIDIGKLREAGEALREAESIYHQSASDITPELHTEFVFGNAYVLRDAASTREWWTRMQAKKPRRFNSDYWKAYAALQWMEGNLKEADEACEKSVALAELLPKAGAYEFDRYCCFQLRKALKDASTPEIIPVLAEGPSQQ